MYFKPYYPVLGSVLGMSAYLVNYATIYLLLRIDGADWHVLSEESPETSYAMAKFTGQIFYNAQFVETRLTAFPDVIQLKNYVTNPAIQGEITSTVPAVVYHLVPICVLVLAGFLLFVRTGRTSSRLHAVTIGISIVPGYLLLSGVGANVFDLTFYQGALYSTFEPHQRPALVVVGILYPLVWGTIGGGIASALR